jgi:hypothetical protein
VPKTISLKTIRTSKAGWVKEVAKLYKSRNPFALLDDAKVGVDPRNDTILQMGVKAGLSRREWSATLICLGVAGIGVWLVVAAVLDPEPFSKVFATIAAGAVLLSTGSLMAVRILTHIKPPNVRVSKTGIFEIYWS